MKVSMKTKKIGKRILSFLIAFAIFTDTLPANVLSGLLSVPLTMETRAEGYETTSPKESFVAQNGWITFSTTKAYMDYCYFYSQDTDFAQNHQDDMLDLTFGEDPTDSRGVLQKGYVGLGTSAHPFNGTLGFSSTEFTLKAYRAIFNYVTDSVQFVDKHTKPVNIKLVRLSDVDSTESKPLFADYVVPHNSVDGKAAVWNVTNVTNETGGTYSGVIGVIAPKADVHLNYTNNSNANIFSGTADVGAICGRMEASAEAISKLTLTYYGTTSGTYSITSNTGNAGGLVGTIEGASVLDVQGYPFSRMQPSITAAKGFAGGLVGELTSIAVISLSEDITSSVESSEASTMKLTNDSLTESTIEVPAESTLEVTEEPTEEPSSEVTTELTEEPTEEPSSEETTEATEEPTEEPSTEVTEEPTEEPSSEVTTEATEEPAEEPSSEATTEVTEEPTEEPSSEATAEASEESSEESSVEPLAAPSVTSTNPILIRGTVTGSKGAGGLFGHYTNIGSYTFNLSKFDINTTVYGKFCGGVFGVLENTNNGTTASDLKLTGSVSTASTAPNDEYAFSGYFGGIVGNYITNNLINSLVLEDLTITVTSNTSFNAFGGAIGVIGGIVDSNETVASSYVKANGVTINASGTDKREALNQEEDCGNYSYFGGLVGATSKDKGVMIDLGNFTLVSTMNVSGSTSYGFLGGGVVGQFYNGVLRLSGTTNMTQAKPDGGYTEKDIATRQSYYGQLVGSNDNVLVYALGNGTADDPAAFETEQDEQGTVSKTLGWRYLRSEGAISDDLGTWGEVVRVFTKDGKMINAEDAEIVSFDPSAHTVTIKSAPLQIGSTIKSAPLQIGSTIEFAKIALNIMLNQGVDYDCLIFENKNESKRDELLKSTIQLTEDINLSNTGISGFMRDGSLTMSDTDIGGVGTFIGTLDGGNKTITLATGESYGLNSNSESATSETEGTGQIYRHRYNGVFSVIGNGSGSEGKILNLTIKGNVYIHNAGPRGMSIGGLAARSHGTTTLQGITANQKIVYCENRNGSESDGKWGKFIGGLIGFADQNSDGNGTINITGSTALNTEISFTYNPKNWIMCGGAIGAVESSSIEINFDSCTISMNVAVDESNKSKNKDSASSIGGLIGYIAPNKVGDKYIYSTRTVNINNTTFGISADFEHGISEKPFTITHYSTQNACGLLGYSWLDVAVNIKKIIVDNAKLNYEAKNIGVLCYDATGVWKVDSLSVDKLLVKGGSDSIGMLVNKAYNDSSGLYLDVLNSGYTLSKSGIELPESLKKYDEIAAYSAQNQEGVLTGNAGVISINMNSARATDGSNDNRITMVTNTGTYQNQLSAQEKNYDNNTTRYYYNLDVMKKENPSENVLLWSVYNYAANNIKENFKYTESPFRYDTVKEVDLSGLSFYPQRNADDIELKNVSLTFGYKEIYDLESDNNTGGTDSYTRDPGEMNQHYLMQSGLFINVPSGKTVTISGNLALAGTFLELEGTRDNVTNASYGYSGVLVSQTVNGNIQCEGNTIITLDGIKPLTTGGKPYSSGYLLINNIVRNSALVDAPKIFLEGIYTTNQYSTDTDEKNKTNATVAKSLIGAASGSGLQIEFSKIKLDAREANSTDTANTDLSSKAEELYTAYGTYNSIFSASTLLESIRTDQNAILVYNYTYEEDWGTDTPRWVTYGKEIVASIEYKDQENWYYGYNGNKRYYTNPIDNSERSEQYSFSTGFLPYVKEVYLTNNSNGLYSRELKVNVMTVALTEGCGTYNDPYVIEDGKQLEAVASFLKTRKTSDLSELNLPKTQLDGIDKYASGNRWCTDKNGTSYHAVFKQNDGKTGYYQEGNPSTQEDWSAVNVQYYLANAYYSIKKDITLGQSYVGLGGTSPNTAFRGVIVGSTTSETDTTPLFTITNKSTRPFIDVTNGCVVKDVNIVVANEAINIIPQTSPGSKDACFDYDSKCRYYGGIIGEIMGGDNIVDNSYVSYKFAKKNAETGESTDVISTIKLSGNYGMLCPVGSYVGVVVFGGLIFRNMNSEKVNQNASNFIVNYSDSDINLTLATSQGAIYVNPLVGRVINGYAVNETAKYSVTENEKYHDTNDIKDRSSRQNYGNKHSLNNNTKHYTIADITQVSNDKEKLQVTNIPSENVIGNITIPNSQAFFILSLITQSCAGTAVEAGGDYKQSLSYGTRKVSKVDTVFGMSHNAKYTEVGTEKKSDYNQTQWDTAADTTVPYIIKNYTSSGENNPSVYNARCVTSIKGYYNITLNKNGSYILPDSFRGIGSVGRVNIKDNDKINELYYTFKLNTFDGQQSKIDIDMYINRYNKKVDNYFDYLHSGTIQTGDDSLSDYDNDAKYKANGFGLFDTFVMKDSSSCIKDFTLSGSVNVESFTYYTDKETIEQKVNGLEVTGNHDDTYQNNAWLSVGGVCGWSRKDHYVMFENIQLNEFSVRGPCRVAGLLGEAGISSTTDYVSVTNCGAEKLSLELTNGGGKDKEAYRNSLGGFIGKVKEGAVKIDGGEGKAVKLKKFSLLTSGGYGYSAGGLVAYAGNGCEVNNMTVCPVDSNTDITIGHKNAGMAGGIVGLMQPQDQNNTTSCVATFEGCIIDNIDILSKNYSGGIYGGTWTDNWVPFKICISDCRMMGDNNTPNNITGNNYAGGFVGYGRVRMEQSGKPNIEIKNSIISNYNITAAKDKYVGGFIGYADSASGSVICYVHDSSIESCKLGGTEKNYAGGIIGYIAQNVENKVLGYNIIMKGITSAEKTEMGAWVGYATSDTADKVTKIQFSGMAVYEGGFAKNVGNNATLNSASFVFADYMGACKGTSITDSEGNITTEYPMNKPSLNYDVNKHVYMPVYPYVNINPQSIIGVLSSTDDQGNTTTTDEIISGDGAVLRADTGVVYEGSTAEKTRAAKIYADTKLTDTNDPYYSRRYTTFVADSPIDGQKTIEYYLQRTVNDDGDRISTYLTEGGSLPAKAKDFAVVVIANSNNDETTNLINRYIQLVTNTSTDYTKGSAYTDYTIKSDYYDIVINRCTLLENGSFVVKENVNPDLPGLKITADGKFALDGANADSKRTNSFTLVDVQFKDPLYTAKIAYHLYVPVYTIKQIEVDFSVAVKTGTASVQYSSDGTTVSNDYTNLMANIGTHVDSLNTWITQYVRFSYQAEDMNALLSSGNLDWYHSKSMIFKTQSAGGNEVRLPGDTFMVLVDPNGNTDKAYYASLSSFDTYPDAKEGWIIDIQKFRGGQESNDKLTFAELVAPYLTVGTGTGPYKVADDKDYDLYRIDGDNTTYYKYNPSEGTVNLVIPSDCSVDEDYYISMYVPKPDSYRDQLYFFQIDIPTVFEGAKESEQSTSVVKSAKVNKQNYYNIMVADLYTEDTSQMNVSPNELQISASNHTLTVDVSTTIRLNNLNAQSYLTGKQLYHSFYLSLNRYLESGEVTNIIHGLDAVDSMQALYRIGETGTSQSATIDMPETKNYLNVETKDIMSDLLSSSDKSLKISATVVLNFDVDQLDEEFPLKTTSDEQIGVNVAASSNLAYDKDRLAYTSMTKEFPGNNNYYYRESANKAILYYAADRELDEYDYDGEPSQNHSRLGLNGLRSEKSEMPIHTEAKYNVSAIAASDVQKASYLRVTFSLSKKTDTIEDGKVTKVGYFPVDNLRTYLGETIIIASSDNHSVERTLPENAQDIVVDIPIEECAVESDIYSFRIQFAAKTGGEFTQYANYKATVKAELIKVDENTGSKIAIENSSASDYIVYTNAKVFHEVIN